MSGKHPRISQESVTRLWLHRQGLAAPRGSVGPTRRNLQDHLERTGALQLDSINVCDRAHYLTLWSRFGPYDRGKLDSWCYGERGVAYEYWGHEASLLPRSHLPLGRRRMLGFPPDSWRNAYWWTRFAVPDSSKRRVLRRLKNEGPLESADFDRQPADGNLPPAGGMKTDKRALILLWHSGKVAIRTRRHFRRVYDLASRVHARVAPASKAAYHDSWLLSALRGCGVAGESHIVNYFTAPKLNAAERKATIARCLRRGEVVEVKIDGRRGVAYALAEHLDGIDQLNAPTGTNLICPFDSFLWQRKRAEDLLDFEYRVEIYVPKPKRRYGYYVLPILHDGRLVGRLDPKLHRDRDELEIQSVHFEPGVTCAGTLRRGLREAIADLAAFLGATKIKRPAGI